MIHEEGMQEIAEEIANMVDHGRFYLGNEEIIKPPFRINYTKDTLRVLLYLDDYDIGKFENFSIITKKGNILFYKPDVIEKTEQEGFVVSFSLKLVEDEQKSYVKKK